MKLSRIGAFEVVLLAFIRANTGDSCSLPRMYTEITSITSDTMNGMRQPQARNSTSVRKVFSRYTTSSDDSSPRVAVVCSELVYRPRLCTGECSATYVTAPPTSPPSASPCSKRNSTSSTVAAMPICS